MVIELCDIRIHSGQNSAFEAAIRQAISTVAAQAQGFQGCKVNRGIDSPDRYILEISWERLEDHTVTFRQGPLFTEWLSIVRPFAVAPPTVEHFELAF